MDRRVCLIFNGHADRGRAMEKGSTLKTIAQRYPNAQWTTTNYPSHATELAERAAQDGVDVVAALGGDGTVHEVINGMARVSTDRLPFLAAVPIGSGNDSCASVGILPDPDAALERVFSGEPKSIDLGVASDGSGRTEYFGNTLGIGFDANVTLYSYQITRLQGFAMYLWAVIQTILRNHDAPHMTITVNGASFQDRILMLTLCNGPREGGGFIVAPEARPDDGILNYACIRKVSRLMMFRLIPEVMKGTHGRFRQVRLGHFHHLKLKSERTLPIHIDGEIFAGFDTDVAELTVQIMPKALQVIT